MKRKPMGKCPHCHHRVRAKVVEENDVLRDVCRCPECGERLVVCRTPGCKDYAEGGDVWDDELCPSCTAALTGVVTTLVTTILTTQIKKSLK